MLQSNAKSLLKGFKFLSFAFNFDGTISIKRMVLVLLVTLIFPLINILGSYFDNTFYLPGNGRGLLQHYGVWAFFITTPIILVFTILSVHNFILLINNVNRYLINERMPKELEKVISAQLNSISLKSNSRFILLLFIIVGFMFSIVNYIQTLHPLETFGNDIYDSYNYKFGFIANRIHLTILWTIIYPVVLFIVVHIYVSTILILKRIYEEKIFYMDLFSEDGCGGASRFRKIILLITCVYLLIFIVMITLKVTHNSSYLTINLPLIFMTIFFIAHNSVGIYYLTKIIKSKKNEYLEKINSQLKLSLNNLSSIPENLLALRDHVINIKTNPYATDLGKLTGIISFFPTLLAVINYLTPFFNTIFKYLASPK